MTGSVEPKKFDKYLEKDDRLDFLSSLKNRSLFVDILPETRVCSDLDDNKFLELAVSGMAQYIITGDNDLLILNTYQGIPIITPADFLAIFYCPQGVTKGFKGNQDKDSSQMNPKEIEWLRQPPKISICYHHSIRPVYKPA